MSLTESESGNRKLEELDLRNRTYNVLKRGGINLENELLKLSLQDLSKFRNMSRKDLQNLLETLVPSWIGSIHSLIQDDTKRTISLQSLVMVLKEEK